ncbi:MAG: histidine kinase [Lachnospiraceae bacterium]|nr:histidine kinase [Lachnospiraceae bacterium]
MIILILRHKSLSTKQIYAFAIYSVVPMLAMAIQAFFFGIHLIAMSTVISALFMHIYIISDQSERLHREEAENAKLKLDILLAQIRPHFLFNTLTGIKHLCGKDPVRAEEAIDQLTKYLRHNMDSLTADIPIPFERELEHVKQYINIQKIRFGDELTVDYDIEYSDFSMPTLTLQPLVENAVTYGIRRSESGTGKVTILTYKSGKMIRIIVEDDGCGFDVNSLYDDTDRSHVGISNVRERIRSISNGTLEIESAPGHGTRVIITIPDIE